MQFNEEEVVLFQERILAIKELLSDLSLMFEAKEEVAPEPLPEPVVEKKAGKAKKVEEVVEEVQPEDEEENSLEDVIAEYELNDMTEEDLKEYLTDYEVKFGKKDKKAKLVELVAQAIVDGVIPAESDEDTEEEEEVAEEETEEASARQAKEAEIIADIDEQIKAKKLTKKKAQDWLKELYANHDTCKACPKNCQEDPLECYKEVQAAFVDDDGEVHETCEAYMRDEVPFCCGVECEAHETDDDKVICSVCGEIWEMGDE